MSGADPRFPLLKSQEEIDLETRVPFGRAPIATFVVVVVAAAVVAAGIGVGLTVTKAGLNVHDSARGQEERP